MSVPRTNVSSPEKLGEGAILFDSVTKVYGEGDDAVKACDEMSFSIDSGEFVSVVGPSGCGKSTLLKMASALLAPTDGRVYINGVDNQSTEYEKQEVGFVFQEPVLLDWKTVRQNILLPVKILKKNRKLEKDFEHYEERTESLIKKVGLEGFGDSYPDELSGGMQQRVAICRGLVYNPSILMMDEPFGALDAFTRDKLNYELLKIWQETNKSIIFVTHNLEEAVFLSDRVLIMSPRPGSVVSTLDIDLPRPRNEDTWTSDRFRELHNDAYTYFKDILFEDE